MATVMAYMAMEFIAGALVGLALGRMLGRHDRSRQEIDHRIQQLANG